jgi:hypothetical protein
MSRSIICLIMLTRASRCRYTWPLGALGDRIATATAAGHQERRLFRNLTGAMKRRALAIYTYVVAERLKLDAIGGGIEHWLARPGAELSEFRGWRGEVPRDAEFLIGTSAKGLLLLRDGRIHRWPSGRYVYGIARGSGASWYFSESSRLHGRIRRVEFAGTAVLADEILYWGLPTRVHQIEFRPDELVVADTYHNRIVLLDAVPGRAGGYWRRHARYIYPDGPLAGGRSSSNYAHFNSIALLEDGGLAVLAHNETTKTGRRSELLQLDGALNVVGRSDTGSSNAHNVYLGPGWNFLTCDSAGGAVRFGGRAYEVGPFPRGLSVSADLVAVGCSPICAERERRDGDGSAEVLFADLDRGRCSRLVLEGTQVHEIRRVDRRDFAMGPQSAHPGLADALEALVDFRRSDHGRREPSR